MKSKTLVVLFLSFIYSNVEAWDPIKIFYQHSITSNVQVGLLQTCIYLSANNPNYLVSIKNNEITLLFSGNHVNNLVLTANQFH